MKKINNLQKVHRADQLAASILKTKSKNHNLAGEKSEQIPENEIPRMRKDIPKEETRNK